MKVDEIYLTEEQLHEINLKHAVAAGALGLSLLGNVRHANAPAPTPQQQAQVQARHQTMLPAQKQVDPKLQKLADNISQRYSVDIELAQEIVELAHKYQKPGFPTAKDILAIVGIESSFDPDAVSGLKKDPAVGLMQVRPGVWNMTREDFANIEDQIATGSNILHNYYKRFKNRDAALAAYNVGPTNYRKGDMAPNYLAKFTRELSHYLGS